MSSHDAAEAAIRPNLLPINNATMLTTSPTDVNNNNYHLIQFHFMAALLIDHQHQTL
jgi:hypothetical protein